MKSSAMALRHSCSPPLPLEAASAMAHPPEEEQFIDPTDWETELFSELDGRKKIFFHLLGHSSPCIERQEHLFSMYAKDILFNQTYTPLKKLAQHKKHITREKTFILNSVNTKKREREREKRK